MKQNSDDSHQEPAPSAAPTHDNNSVPTKAPTTSSSTTSGSHPKSKPHHPPIAAIIVTAVVIILAIFFGFAFFTRDHNNIIHHGEIIYGESLTEANLDFLRNIIPTNLELSADITIERTQTTHKVDPNFSTDPACSDSADGSPCPFSPKTYVLYDILLPTTDFYDPTISISESAALDGNLTSIWNLQPDMKLLALGDNYYLDTLDSGAFFQYFTLSGESTDRQKIADLLQAEIADFPTEDTLFTFAQTGVTALSRRMNTKLDQVGDATYFSEYIADFLKAFDMTHTSNESSFSNSANGSNICSKPAMIDVITDIGIDIIELTGNHNTDCGDLDAIATIDQYHNLGIQTVGGGVSADAASIPLAIDQKDTHITMLAYNLSTGGYTLDDTPGANFYTREKAQQDITAAKDRGDFIIVDIQYYECNEYVDTNENTTCDAADSSAGDQIGFFRELIDMGANIVVGTSAHQPQTFELYHDGAIYYGLGNLFFDQSTWPGTTRSLILINYFWQGDLIQTRIVPTIYDNNFQTKLMDTTAATDFLRRLINARPVQTNG